MKQFLILFFSLSPMLSSIYGQNKTLDSLYQKIAETTNDSVKAELHNDIAFELVNLSLYEKAQQHYKSLYEISSKINYTKGQWAYWSGMATILLNENKLDEALASYFELKKLMQKQEADSVNFAVLYSSIANVYDAKSMYNNAVEYHSKALSIFNKADNKPYEAIVLGNLASIYFKNQDYDNAIKFHEQSLEIKKVHSSPYSIGTGLFNYAQVYDRLKNNQKTIDLLNESIVYLEEANDQAGLALCYTSLGLTYVNLTENNFKDTFKIDGNDNTVLSKEELLKKAFDYQIKAISIFDSLNERYQIGHAYNGAGTVLINQKKPQKALEYYHKSYNQFADTKLEIAKVAAEGLAEGHKDLKQFDSAYYWQKEMITILNKIDEQTNAIELGRQQAKLIYQQEKEIEQLKNEQQTNKLINEKNTRTRFIIGLLILIISLLTIFYFIRKNLQTKNNLLIIEKEQTSLLSTIEGEEKERERISIELHDGIASALTGLRLKLASKNITTEELEDNLKVINSEIRTISHQLTTPKIEQLNTTKPFFEQLISTSFTHQNVNLTCFPEDDKLNLSKQNIHNLYRTIQEVFQNIVKHAKASEINISYNRSEQLINIIIEDNGIGFDIENTKKGIGLDNIQKRLLPLNGEIEIDSSLGRGTCIIINIKIV